MILFDQYEFVDIDKVMVGNFQVRDYWQWQEGKLQEGFFQCCVECEGGLLQMVQCVVYCFIRFKVYQVCNGQCYFVCYFVVLNDDKVVIDV